jgi:RHS repeat-associated protein
MTRWATSRRSPTSAIGAYSYGPGTACGNAFAGPHAVSAVAGSKNASYCYDSNGNLTQGDGRTVAWTAFNMPAVIQQNARQVAITYGPDRGRFKRVDLNETGTSTTYYVAGGSHEVIESGTTVTHKTYIGGAAVVIEVTSAPASTETVYLLHDHLGSTDVITAADGTVQTRNSFDAWGRRRDVTWAAFFPTVPASLWQTAKTTRGFTGHEQLDEVGLVHMNGRVYDPELGRFLSADPFVQDATDLQAYNHYAYVRNNPLSLLDPSGFSWIGDVFSAIGNFFSGVWNAITGGLKAILSNSIFRAVIQIAICAIPAVGVPGCALAAAGLTLASGGSAAQAALAFIFTFASAAVWGAEGDLTTSRNFIDATGGGGLGTKAATVLAHGVVGGALSVSQGGNFMQGFAAGAAGEAATLGSSGQSFEVRLAVVAAAGGLASQLTGGKFANGAITGAFAYLYNDCGPGHGGGCEAGGLAKRLGEYLDDSWTSLRDGVSNFLALSPGEMAQHAADAALAVPALGVAGRGVGAAFRAFTVWDTAIPQTGRYLNVGTDMTATAFRQALEEVGYNVVSQGVSKNGAYAVLSNGVMDYTFYLASSGAVSAQVTMSNIGQILVKYRLGGW